MKAYLIPAMVAVAGLIASCKKQVCPGPDHNPGHNPTFASRTVRYELYTDANLSGDKKNIHFSVYMRDGRNNIFDSSLAVMKVENIPDFAHRIIIEKLVPGNDAATLAVGFNYQIDDVGLSWYTDAFPSVDSFKVVKFLFR